MNKLKLIFLLPILISIICLNNANAFLFWNQACHFSGASNKYVAVASSPSLDITGSFTLEAWILPDNSVSPAVQIIMDKRTGSAPDGFILFLSNGKAAIATNSITRLVGNTVLPNKAWSHVSVTFNSSNFLFSIYINGVPDGSNTVSGSIPVSNDDSINVGKGIAGVNLFSGDMDEVRIWRRNLSAAEVVEYRRTTLGASTGLYTSLVLSLTFQDKESTGTDFSLFDWSNNNNNGVNKGVSVLDLNNRPSVTITPNDCIELDGVNDYVTGADNANISPVSGVTLEAWIFPRSVTGSKYIIHKGTATGSGVNYLFRLNGNTLSAIINGSPSLNSTQPISSNEWTHAAFTYNGITGRYAFYINGRKSNEGNIQPGNINNGSENLNIGGNGIAGNFFNGFIDEVRISNYVKSQSEITGYLYKSIDQSNEPNSALINVVYNLDGYAFDNADSGPVLSFMNEAAFAHSGAVDNQPVSPINRADNLNFSNSFYFKSTGKRIPESGITGNVVDSLEISFDTLISDVNVFVAMNHNAEEEMDIYLIGPGGESVLLYANQSLVQNSDNVITVFDDQSDSSITNNFRYVSYAPAIKPRNSLNTLFSGKFTPGIWRLVVADETGSGTGRLYAWGIQFNNMSAKIPGLALRVFMQGFYREIDSCVTDTINVFLKESVSPYPDVGIMGETPDNGYIGNYNFYDAALGVQYYLAVRHRNSIETWSAHPVAFDLFSAGLTYDFTVSADSAYGSNQIQVEDVPLRFAMYGGDVNQEGNVDAADLSEIDDDAFAFAVGYLNTDVTGDNAVDAADLTIADNNAFNFITKIVPP